MLFHVSPGVGAFRTLSFSATFAAFFLLIASAASMLDRWNAAFAGWSGEPPALEIASEILFFTALSPLSSACLHVGRITLSTSSSLAVSVAPALIPAAVAAYASPIRPSGSPPTSISTRSAASSADRMPQPMHAHSR
jgi:hypothetical protein